MGKIVNHEPISGVAAGNPRLHFRSALTRFGGVIWTVIAATFLVLYFCKLSFAVIGSSNFHSWFAVISILILLYLLFMLEGLQVAGIQIKDQSLDGIREKIGERKSERSRLRSLRICKIFIEESFDSFVTGRQVLVIVTVVSMSTVLSFVRLPTSIFDYPLLGTTGEPINHFAYFLNSAGFAFIASTLLPSWLSQLLPQFTADNRSLTFIRIPGSLRIIQLSIFIDKLQIGYPARLLTRTLEYAKVIPKRKLSLMDRDIFYKSAVAYYGLGKEEHFIKIDVDQSVKITENLVFNINNGYSKSLSHKTCLSKKVNGRIKVKLQGSENTLFLEPVIEEVLQGGSYFYLFQFHFDRTNDLRDQELIHVSIEFEFDSVSESSEQLERQLEFSTSIPLAKGGIAVNIPRGEILEHPTITVRDASNLAFAPSSYSEKLYSLKLSKMESNNFIADISYPLVGCSYRINYAYKLDKLKQEKPNTTSASFTNQNGDYKEYFLLPNKGQLAAEESYRSGFLVE